jgi:hypothetical protein
MELNRIDQASNDYKSDLKMLRMQILAIDSKNISTEEQSSKAKSLLKKIDTLIELEEIRKVMNEIFDHLDRYEYEQAAAKFDKNSKIALVDANRKSDLIQQISNTTIKNVKSRVNELMDTQLWDKARQTANAPLNSSTFRDLVQGRLPEHIDFLSKQIDENEDKHLYSLIKNKGLAALNYCDAYIDKAPVGKMKPDVNAYRNWIVKMNDAIPMSLKIQSVDWHKNHWSSFGNYNNSINVSINNKQFLGVVDVRSDEYNPGKKLMFANGAGVEVIAFKSKIDAALNIDVNISSSYFSGKDKGDQVNGRIGPNGNELLLEPVTYDNGNKVNFILVRNPPGEPDLPQWKGNAP